MNAKEIEIVEKGVLTLYNIGHKEGYAAGLDAGVKRTSFTRRTILQTAAFTFGLLLGSTFGALILSVLFYNL